MRTNLYRTNVALCPRRVQSAFSFFHIDFFFKAVHVVTEYVMALMIRILLCFVYSPRMFL